MSDSPETIIPADNNILLDEPLGGRPYEMVWAGRTEDRVPLVDFEDLAGWKLALYNGAMASFGRSREQQMWGQFVGKLSYSGKSSDSRVMIQPPTPLIIPGTFDCVSMWVYGNNWDWIPDPTTPKVELAIHIIDSNAREYRIPLTNVRWKEWWLVHKHISKDILSRLSFPCKFAAIEVGNLSNTEIRTIYFDSLCFYAEQLKPLAFEPRPARNIKPFRGQDHGLNGTGPGRLPFPTREETILPENLENDFSNSVRQVASSVFLFCYDGADGRVEYRYDPSLGEPGLIQVFVNGKLIGNALDDAGVRFENEPGQRRLESTSLESGLVTAIFKYDGDPYCSVEYTLRIIQKSLVIDAVCRGGRAMEFSFGRLTGLTEPKLITIPYITYSESNPSILLCGTEDAPVFVSIWLDWYCSNGSEPYSYESIQENTARINGGVRYYPKTDGKRNDLYERVFLTASPFYEETLPTIANPPSPWGKVAGERLWQESWGPQDFRKEHERSKILRSYGIEKLIQCNHEISWRDGGESFTLRTKAAPKKGGDEALAWFVGAQKSLGWKVGLYTNYTDFAPVNEYWNEDFVQRTPEGDLRPAWPRCYALKPSRAVEMEARLAPIIKRKYGQNSSYTDVHTAVAPWRYCDYDTRVPGAGTFAATFYAYGELLLNERRVYDGPIFSEGTYQWLYAGLTDGNYALAYTSVDLSREPLNVAFDLYKIHPLECDIGMGWTAYFFRNEKGWDDPTRIDKSIDQFIATTLAYGHLGWLVEERLGIRLTCRSYYMIQQVSKRYALEKVRKIEYADERGRMMSLSRAIATDIIRNSKIHIVYENGLELYINGSRDTDWKIDHDGEGILLPPFGWLIFDNKGFFEASYLENGNRVDKVISEEYVYLDGRGKMICSGHLAATGAVVMKFVGPDEAKIIDIEGNVRIGFKWRGDATCMALSPEGEELGQVQLWRDGEMLYFSCTPGARAYSVTNK